MRSSVPQAHAITRATVPGIKAGVRKDHRLAGLAKSPRSHLRGSSGAVKKRPDRTDPKLPGLKHGPRNAPTEVSGEEAEIHILERKLGLTEREALPRAFHEDGLAALIDGLDAPTIDIDAPVKQRLSGKEGQTLPEKLPWPGDRLQSLTASESEESDGLTDMDEQGSVRPNASQQRGCPVNDGEEDVQLADGRPEEPAPANTRDLATLGTDPAVEADQVSYIPPARRSGRQGDQSLRRLHRHVQGLLNKLSASNFLSIVDCVEELYGGHPAGLVTSILVDDVLAATSGQLHVGERFVILLSSFFAALVRKQGRAFGTPAVQRVVEAFDDALAEQKQGHNVGKRLFNMASLLARLYKFKVIGSALVCDLLREMTRTAFSKQVEAFTELLGGSFPKPICDLADRLLEIVQDLEQDDPKALAEIVSCAQTAIAAARSDQLLTREQFLFEELVDLMTKQRKLRKPGAMENSNLVALMKRTLKSVARKAPSGDDSSAMNVIHTKTANSRQFERVTDVQSVFDSEGNLATLDDSRYPAPKLPMRDGKSLELWDDPSRLVQLAKQERMNTSARRSIFVSIMSADDYRDAHARLLRLRLNKPGHLDIPKVLVHCAMSEENYNHYYSLLAQQLCMDKTLKGIFQYTLWDKVLREHSTPRCHDPVADPGSNRAILNLAGLYGHLVGFGSLDILILKVGCVCSTCM